MSPAAQLYPGARWHPLGAQSEPRMTAHDIVCLHTMVGYLVSTDAYFRIGNGRGYRGAESHYGVGGPWGPDLRVGGLDGAVWQWQDRAYAADANLDGWRNVISVETADNGGPSPGDIPPWTPAQVEAIAGILAWESSPAAHHDCPASWACHADGIPLALIPDTRPGRRGVGYHAQGVPGVGLVAGGVAWSKVRGKPCPTARRIAQIDDVIARARTLRRARTPKEWDEMATRSELAEVVRDVVRGELDRHGRGVVGEHVNGQRISRDRGNAQAARYAFYGNRLTSAVLQVVQALATGQRASAGDLAAIRDLLEQVEDAPDDDEPG